MVIKTVSGCSGQLAVIWAALSIPVFASHDELTDDVILFS